MSSSNNSKSRRGGNFRRGAYAATDRSRCAGYASAMGGAGGGGPAGIGLGAGERSTVITDCDRYDAAESGAGGDESAQRLRRRRHRRDDGRVSGIWRDASESFAAREQLSDAGEGCAATS